MSEPILEEENEMRLICYFKRPHREKLLTTAQVKKIVQKQLANAVLRGEELEDQLVILPDEIELLQKGDRSKRGTGE